MLQLPVYILGPLGEVLWQVSRSEYASKLAAAHMRSTLQALTMLTEASMLRWGLQCHPQLMIPV